MRPIHRTALTIAGAILAGALPFAVVVTAFSIEASAETVHWMWTLGLGAALAAPFVLGLVMALRRDDRLAGFASGLWIGVGLLFLALVPALGVVVVDGIAHAPGADLPW